MTRASGNCGLSTSEGSTFPHFYIKLQNFSNWQPEFVMLGLGLTFLSNFFASQLAFVRKLRFLEVA